MASLEEEPDVVESPEEAARSSKPPLLVMASVRAFLDEHGLGSGAVAASRIGEGGGSNFSFLLERGGERYVLRRPPRPPLPPSAHDVVREANLQLALAPLGVRVPRIRAICEDEGVLGVPFYVADYVEGEVITSRLSGALEHDRSARRRLGEDLIDALVEIHAADVSAPALAALARPGSYLERQVRRFRQLWEVNATRSLALVGEVGGRLADSLPAPSGPVVVHGDYRLGNIVVSCEGLPAIVVVLDWEMGAIGDPRADVGYLLATYSEPDGEPSPLGTSPVTATPGFPTRRQLAERYVERSGRDLEPLAWFEALAMFKAAVFCDAIYGRFLRGDLTARDARAAAFEHIVPALARGAAARLATIGA